MKKEITTGFTENCLVVVVDLLMAHATWINGRRIRILRIEDHWLTRWIHFATAHCHGFTHRASHVSHGTAHWAGTHVAHGARTHRTTAAAAKHVWPAHRTVSVTVMMWMCMCMVRWHSVVRWWSIHAAWSRTRTRYTAHMTVTHMRTSIAVWSHHVRITATAATHMRWHTTWTTWTMHARSWSHHMMRRRTAWM